MEKYSKQPIYLKLVAFLKNYIQNNMKKDQKLLSERDISLRLKISRYTVRRALDELEKRGYIYKIHGKGTFVSEKSPLTPLNDIYSFTDHMKAIGKTPQTDLLEYKIFNSDSFLASKFNIKQGEKVIKLKFLRAADKQPMMIERTYLPYEKFSTLTIEQLTQNSLYLIMKTNFHQTVRLVNEAIQASLIQAKDAKLLKVSYDAPCLKVKRTSFNNRHIPIEYTYCVARGDQFIYNHSYLHQEKDEIG